MGRERMAHREFDFGDDEMAPAPRATRARPAPQHASPAPKGERRHPGMVTRARLLMALGVLTGGIIIANAVMFQSGKHPKPLFGAETKKAAIFPAPPSRPESAAMRMAAFEPRPMAGVKPGQVEPPKPKLAAAPPAAAADQPSEALVVEIQRELGKRGFFKGESDGKVGPQTVQAIRDFQFSQRVAIDGKPNERLLAEIQSVKVTMKDELMDLVKRSTGDDKTQRTVLDVQRALNKSGYGPLTEDGQLGPSTKAALARFEQDKKLPPRGEPKGPVLRALASASGIRITQ
jgi:peptidoglycan hydrolase-like protein with peptidoglycan-binding domain